MYGRIGRFVELIIAVNTCIKYVEEKDHKSDLLKSLRILKSDVEKEYQGILMDEPKEVEE